MEGKEKKVYTPPQLTAHGTVEEITLGSDTPSWASDGDPYERNPVGS